MASTYTYQVKRKLQLQRSALISNLTAAELVRTYAALYEVYLDRRQIMALLAQVQLTEQANALARQMSGGQQQRLAMANDPAARCAIWDIVRAFCQRGRTVLITTHSMEEAETIYGRVAILDRVCVVVCDTPANTWRSRRLTQGTRSRPWRPPTAVAWLTSACASPTWRTFT